MALKIRLARGGAKGRPFYRIVVAEATSPRDGRFVERIGSYNPILSHDNPERVVVNIDRLKYWHSVGAKATDRVEKFMVQHGIVSAKDRRVDPVKSAPKKKAQERIKVEAAAEEEKRAAAKAAVEAEAAAKAAPVVAEEPAAETSAEEPAAE